MVNQKMRKLSTTKNNNFLTSRTAERQDRGLKRQQVVIFVLCLLLEYNAIKNQTKFAEITIFTKNTKIHKNRPNRKIHKIHKKITQTHIRHQIQQNS